MAQLSDSDRLHEDKGLLLMENTLVSMSWSVDLAGRGGEGESEEEEDGAWYSKVVEGHPDEHTSCSGL